MAIWVGIRLSTLGSVRDQIGSTLVRCGMVYFDYGDLGWHPSVNSWLSRRSDRVSTLVRCGMVYFDYGDLGWQPSCQLLAQ